MTSKQANFVMLLVTYIVVIVTLILGGLLAQAQTVQPIKPATTPVDFALYSSVLASRASDYISTERLLDRGGRELLLPKGLVESKPAFAIFSLGSGVAEIYAARKLSKHHPRLARYVLLSDGVSAGIVAGHNVAITPTKRR